MLSGTDVNRATEEVVFRLTTLNER